MTQAELDLLPTLPRSIFVALFQKDDDGGVIDADGEVWKIGWLNGVRVKQRGFL